MDDKHRSIHDNRQSDYGAWKPNMRGTSEQIQGLLTNFHSCNPGRPLPEWWAPLVMVAVKLNRIASGRFKQDSFDDLRIYLEFVETLQREAAEKAPDYGG
jgi:hypothetical protein